MATLAQHSRASQSPPNSGPATHRLHDSFTSGTSENGAVT